VTLTVSRGPKDVEVPDVTNADRESAVTALKQAGFKVDVVKQDSEDVAAENIVQAQDPIPLSRALPGSRVTIYVGHYVPPAPDTSPPSTPFGLIGSAESDTSIALSWEAATDDSGEVAGYRITRDGGQIDDVGTTTYTDSGLSPGTTYAYEVTAYDAAGNTSQASSVTVTTTGALPTPTPDPTPTPAGDPTATDTTATDTTATDTTATDTTATDVPATP
jgi:chitodextrinase